MFTALTIHCVCLCQKMKSMIRVVWIQNFADFQNSTAGKSHSFFVKIEGNELPVRPTTGKSVIFGCQGHTVWTDKIGWSSISFLRLLFIAYSKDRENLEILYPHHYDPRLVYFLPHFPLPSKL